MTFPAMDVLFTWFCMSVGDPRQHLEVGFELAQIIQILDQEVSSETIQKMLRARRAELRRHIQEEQERLAALPDNFCQSRPLQEKFAQPSSHGAIHFHC
jgi:DNA-binding transcriptional MerR regulator